MKPRHAVWICLAGMTLAGCRTGPQDAMKETRRETLARHETRAEFQALTKQTCRGLTALCPERCGHSGTMATFRIIEYIRFEKLSGYGRQQEVFAFLLEDNRNRRQVDPSVYKTVMALAKGDEVRLCWNHDYVTRNGSSGPERPITTLEPFQPPVRKE
jgi:hypothetical protein